MSFPGRVATAGRTPPFAKEKERGPATNRIRAVDEFCQMKHPDLILAGASVRSLAESAVRDGLRPVCVDMFGDEDLRKLVFQQFGTLAGLKTVQRFSEVPDVLADIQDDVPLIAVGGIENDFEVMAALRRQRPVLSPAETMIRELRDPEILFPVLAAGDCRMPRYVCGQTHPPQLAGAPPSPNERWLMKSTQTAGGQGVQNFDFATWKQEPLPERHYLQEFIDGVPMSATFCRLDSNVRLLGCALQLSGCAALNAPPFWFCGNAGPVRVSLQLHQQFQKIGQCLGNRWPIRGLFGVDVIVQGGEVFVIEVNPRLTASHELHELAKRDSPGHVSLHLAAYDELSHSSRLPDGDHAAATTPLARLIMYAECDIQISTKQLTAMQKLGRHPPENPARVWLADLPGTQAMIPQGTPFCSVYLNLDANLTDDTLQELLADTFSERMTGGITRQNREIQGIFGVIK